MDHKGNSEGRLTSTERYFKSWMDGWRHPFQPHYK